MRLFPHLQKGKLQPAWRYKTNGVIWRIVPTRSGRIIGEERDLTKKTVSFFCLNETTGEVLWEGLNYGEQWWMGIEAADDTRMFLHRFAAPDLPRHSGIIAADLDSGKQIWSHDDLTFSHLGSSSVLAYRDSMEGREFVELDAGTGSIIRSVRSDDSAALETVAVSEHAWEDELEFPLPVLPGTDEYTRFRSVTQIQVALENGVGPVEVIDRKEVTIFSYHQQDAPGVLFNNILTIVDKVHGAVLYNDILNARVPAPVPESFFVRRDMVYSVKERSLLVAVQLPGAI